MRIPFRLLGFAFLTRSSSANAAGARAARVSANVLDAARIDVHG